MPDNKRKNLIVAFSITFLACCCVNASTQSPKEVMKGVLWELKNSSRNIGVDLIKFSSIASLSMTTYVSGKLADSWRPEILLMVGMVGSGISLMLFGGGFFLNIHTLWFYLVMQILAGVFQSLVWPAVMVILGIRTPLKWKASIMAAWNSHICLGNFLGACLAVNVLRYGWGWSFIVLGGLLFLGAAVVHYKVEALGSSEPQPENSPAAEDLEAQRSSGPENSPVVEDESVPHRILEIPEIEDQSALNLESFNEDDDNITAADEQSLESQIVSQNHPTDDITAANEQSLESQIVSQNHPIPVNNQSIVHITLVDAFRTPGVLEYACCIFLLNLTAYIFFSWFPFYTKKGNMSAQVLSFLFDVGGFFGGLVAGFLSDMLMYRAIPASALIFASVPAMLLYRKYGSTTETISTLLLLMVGFCVNGSRGLINTAVSADLGVQSSQFQATGRIAGIIKGTGSIGDAAGCLLLNLFFTGLLESGWDIVFTMLITCAVAAGLLLSAWCGIELTPQEADPASQPLLSDQT